MNVRMPKKVKIRKINNPRNIFHNQKESHMEDSFLHMQFYILSADYQYLISILIPVSVYLIKLFAQLPYAYILSGSVLFILFFFPLLP